MERVREAAAAGVTAPRPALVGPVTYLLLAKAADGAPEGFDPLDRLDEVVEVYAQLLAKLADAGAAWVQLEESAFVNDRGDAEIDALRRAFDRLAGTTDRPRILVTTSYATPARPSRSSPRAASQAVADAASGAAAGGDAAVRSRVASIDPADRTRTEYAVRAKAQQGRLGLPPLATTTTIGSFPQTPDVRKARADWAKGRLDDASYRSRMQAEIERVVRLQEEIGLDVLVHGEPERNDMVQYFAEQPPRLRATELGWVQSYGSRCVRPPILHGDVSRPEPITVEWAHYAQSLTDRPVKGMLTGPVTILAWSFVRDDQPLAEPPPGGARATRRGRRPRGGGHRDHPGRRAGAARAAPAAPGRRSAYLDWAVGSFRLATGGAAEATQIHTHLCYSEFGDVIDAIDGLDADVTTIEAARSRMEVLADLQAVGFSRGVGPGVYDIHSPRVPARGDRLADRRGAAGGPADRLWINPGLRPQDAGYEQVEPTLRAMVEAARAAR